jgi:hypothetical protein
MDLEWKYVVQTQTPYQPGQRYSSAMAVEPYLGGLILFGGIREDNVFLNQTWVFSLLWKNDAKISHEDFRARFFSLARLRRASFFSYVKRTGSGSCLKFFGVALTAKLAILGSWQTSHAKLVTVIRTRLHIAL